MRLTNRVEVGHRAYEWELTEPRPLAQRVEVPGRLGLFDVTDALPAAVLALTGPVTPVRHRPAVREIHRFLGQE